MIKTAVISIVRLKKGMNAQVEVLRILIRALKYVGMGTIWDTSNVMMVM